MARRMIGTVVSDVQNKTIVVKTERRVTHPIYRKQYTVSTKYQAHDEKNEAKLGDKVAISETRPVSKTKTWKLDEIVERREGAAEEVVA
ncbi:MAG TPA: 30S ribosomal protein S17 [Candidatus Saccharibacteria bacterium]|nr:small subunit ribosomal protein [Patescibacteria group bacterium]HMS31062.1 30S ribosomal protein S17 [Candidatus Saccharibacteria bacterium]